MNAQDTDSTKIKPLIKRVRGSGQLYVRRPEVEEQLEQIKSFGNDRIFTLLKNRNKHIEGFLFDETIFYLLREAQMRQDNSTVETLYLELNRRIWQFLRRFHKNFSDPADFEDFGQKVELAIIQKIFDVNSDSADYAQVNFGDYVITQAKVTWRGNLIKINKEKDLFTSGRHNEEESDKSDPQFESSEMSAEDKLILREAIGKLAPNTMKAAVLILDGWQIESKDDNELTISTYMNVSSRTIRNWMKEARQILAGYEGEIR
jgi:DNA-directed RNA polymerase specialized sigma24 family protein